MSGSSIWLIYYNSSQSVKRTRSVGRTSRGSTAQPSHNRTRAAKHSRHQSGQGAVVMGQQFKKSKLCQDKAWGQCHRMLEGSQMVMLLPKLHGDQASGDRFEWIECSPGLAGWYWIVGKYLGLAGDEVAGCRSRWIIHSNMESYPMDQGLRLITPCAGRWSEICQRKTDLPLSSKEQTGPTKDVSEERQTEMLTQCFRVNNTGQPLL
ncbi:predicted protein [Histoplasma capsulatum var. duboisii H88]|uniref:Predicted protein n=1 Tax=Ajellomyces capsulatus (strain H88) TaxID=544711 RepID=F0UN33_AJEC8|nr:predicted protein [Histoplasma capsulatum var. duboisii H88]